MKQNKKIVIHKSTAVIRKLFLAGIAISIVTGLLILEGQRLKLYDGIFGSALGIILVIITFSFLMGILAQSLKRAINALKEVELRPVEVKDEISANELIYQNLIENSGVVMYTTSIDGDITFSSSKALQLTGYSIKELASMHYTSLLDSDWMEEVQSKYKSQLANNIEETNMEFCIRTKFGDKKWVEQSAVLITQDDKHVGFQCIVKDISERKEMEAVLRKYELELVQNQERLQSILDNATSLMYIKDLDGKYLLINKQFKEVLGVTDTTVIGKTDFDFAERKQAFRFKYSDDEVIKTRKPVQLEEMMEMADGKQHHILIIKFPLLNTQNEIYGISGIATDISERVRYEEQLIEAKRIAEDAKKLQEQFLANMSHEIRTPMNGIQGMVDLLLETTLDAEQKDFIKTIKRSSDSLLVIINDILDFSKIQAGKLTIEKIDFKINDIVENISVIFKHRLQEKNLNFNFDIDKNIPSTLSGDPYRLNQILVNLVGNSIKFTQQGSLEINVALQNKSEKEIILKFSIKDTGIGIPEDKISAIFESFTQASSETTRKYGGTGLGLAITKQLLEMQNGNISVESKLNEGTTFIFTIPYACSQTGNTANFKSGDVKDYRATIANKKFLVAEDNEVNQKVIRHVLQKAGGVVDIANNGLEALDFLKKQSDYDLIIMDLQMPEMDGYTATKHIRTEMKITIPIIAMTASVLKGEKDKCLAIGMSEYLSKPFDSAFLYKRISELINEIPQVQKSIKMPNEKIQSEKLFDLSFLEEMDDHEYTTDILMVYLKNTPDELKELQKACSSKMFDATYKAAHKIKGSTSLLQATTLIKILEKIEEFAKAEINEGLAILAEQANEEYKKLVTPLKDYLKSISSGSGVTI